MGDKSAPYSDEDEEKENYNGSPFLSLENQREDDSKTFTLYQLHEMIVFISGKSRGEFPTTMPSDRGSKVEKSVKEASAQADLNLLKTCGGPHFTSTR